LEAEELVKLADITQEVTDALIPTAAHEGEKVLLEQLSGALNAFGALNPAFLQQDWTSDCICRFFRCAYLTELFRFLAAASRKVADLMSGQSEVDGKFLFDEFKFYNQIVETMQQQVFKVCIVVPGPTYSRLPRWTVCWVARLSPLRPRCSMQ
jgi:hypothetical protein